LRASAEKNWTISAEVVDRLEQSFAAPATPTQAFFAVLAHTIDGLTSPKALFRDPADGRANANWLNNPYTFREACRAVERALDLVQQHVAPGELPVGEDPALAQGFLATPDGRVAFEMWWEEVRQYNPKAPIDNSRPERARHLRRLAMLREGLKSLADKIELYGLTGKEAQRRQKGSTLSRHDFNRLRRLARMRIESGLSQERHKLFQELLAKAPAAHKEKWNLGDLSNPGPFGPIDEPIHTSPLDEDNRPLDVDSDVPPPVLRGKIDPDDEENLS